ncbi:efflux RND transporter periplasmic adaptor subunit [Comamonas piscis]|uniref:Efflux RND transporter periplasmic adaptor subunit n=1 Tax=Comamonas piscis TaxID=1562974 RepID=A0A7G5EJ32_9BURK|nr:efflux RND transporter periplasmic adaptor subunit [Comamonas piscis]QMV74007.1 efflux RND transporter periplasmic adaptor subunit [Comamonas piscis]WSO32437.1 efflux RND transporter periplasmic adaptor subunit [Comamonas piscis]
MKRALPWLAAAVVAVLLASGLWRGWKTQQNRQQALAQAEQAKAQAVYQLAPSDAISVAPQTLLLSLPISGTVKAVNTAIIKARIAGELQQLQLREGDPVQAGQVVARVDSTESQARLAQAQQQADAAHAQQDIQQRQYDNNRALANQGFISATALESSQSQWQAAQSNYQAARSAADVLRKNLSDTVLRSPIQGQVARKWVSNGEKVGPDANVLEIVDLRALELQAQMPAADSLQLRLGQMAQLQVDGSGQPISAEVVRINPQADANSRSVTVYLRIAAPAASATAAAPALRQGLYLQGQLVTGQVQTIAIPLAAVRTDKPEPYVQLLSAQGESGESLRVQHQPVVLGARSQRDGATWVAVTQGLQAGQRILGGQVGQLREATPVRLAPEAAPATPASPAS